MCVIFSRLYDSSRIIRSKTCTNLNYYSNSIGVDVNINTCVNLRSEVCWRGGWGSVTRLLPCYLQNSTGTLYNNWRTYGGLHPHCYLCSMLSGELFTCTIVLLRLESKKLFSTELKMLELWPARQQCVTVYSPHYSSSINQTSDWPTLWWDKWFQIWLKPLLWHWGINLGL